MKLYRVVVSFEVDAENEDEAIREASNIANGAIVESVTLVEEPAPTKSDIMIAVANALLYEKEVAKP